MCGPQKPPEPVVEPKVASTVESAREDPEPRDEEPDPLVQGLEDIYPQQVEQARPVEKGRRNHPVVRPQEKSVSAERTGPLYEQCRPWTEKENQTLL